MSEILENALHYEQEIDNPFSNYQPQQWSLQADLDEERQLEEFLLNEERLKILNLLKFRISKLKPINKKSISELFELIFNQNEFFNQDSHTSFKSQVEIIKSISSGGLLAIEHSNMNHDILNNKVITCITILVIIPTVTYELLTVVYWIITHV